VVAFGDIDIHAFDRQTGASRWHFHGSDGDAPGALYLATDGQTVFAGSPTGKVFAVDASNGALRWSALIAPEPKSWAFNPVFSNGTVYICVKRFTVPTTGGVVALDAATGDVRWRREFPPTPPLSSAACNQRVVVLAGLVVAASDDGHIYAMDGTTGDVRWSAGKLAGLPPGAGGDPPVDDRPLIAGAGVIVAGSLSGYLAAYDAATGTEKWRSTAHRGSATYPLSADNEAVYATHSGLQLAAFDLATGALKWIAGDAADGGEFYPSPAPDADRLYVSGVSGYFALRR
jgi:outer membrane protein assembly factor BamB